MTKFFIEGGFVFMSIQTLLFLLIPGLSVLASISMFGSAGRNPQRAKNILGHIKSLALFTLAFANNK